VIEPASDLAVAAALCSSVRDQPAPAHALFLGEIGLGGEVRPVGGVERRLAEAERLGFRTAFLSARVGVTTPLATVPIDHVSQLAGRLAA
jgi:DNA repair protein RadA/Sms